MNITSKTFLYNICFPNHPSPWGQRNVAEISKTDINGDELVWGMNGVVYTMDIMAEYANIIQEPWEER